MAPDPGLSNDARHSGRWVLQGDGKALTSDDVVAPIERLTWPRTIGSYLGVLVGYLVAAMTDPSVIGSPSRWAPSQRL